MARPFHIAWLFLDIGGVLLTNSWGHESRQLAAEKFKLDAAEMEVRHHLNFETHEIGKLTLDEYLDRVVFFQPRPFHRDEFRAFMFSQSKPLPEIFEYLKRLKKQYGLKVAVVSNEAREQNAYRIETYRLAELADLFVSSCYVGLRKPDKDIFRLALDLSQARPEQVVFIDNTALFVQIAEQFGMHGIVHTGFDTTRAALEVLDLLGDKA